MLDPKIPNGALPDKWTLRQYSAKLISPVNRRQYKIIVVGTGLAGASAAATLGELGYQVESFCFQDSSRRAHSIAAQGGINAAKNYPNDGDSVRRLFTDTVKGGDFRSREANVYRLAQLSNIIIDQCVAQGVPFARDYGGYLDNRSFGGAQVSRTFYARGQTGQQLLLGAYQALMKEVVEKNVVLHPRCEMLDLVVIDGVARGIVTRDLITGEVFSHAADAVVLATGGYSNVFYLSTNAKGCNVTAAWRAYKKGAFFANPCYTQIHPTCIPVHGDYQSKLTLMSESLRNDGRVWVPHQEGRDYFLERKYPAFGNLVPRDIASRNVKEQCDAGHGVGDTGQAVYLDLKESIVRLGRDVIKERYGNLLEMYAKITGDDPYQTPMMIYPAAHYTMGGLWVDYDLMSNLPGLFVIGEANFADHGANRLGASALMQGLADGYFILPTTIADYLARVTPNAEKIIYRREFQQSEIQINEKIKKLLSINGKTPVDRFHRELGALLWDKCGMVRNETGLKQALAKIPEIRERFWKDVRVLGGGIELNQALERAGRVADFLEFSELMCWDALERKESCGSHFREEYQTAEGEAQRRDDLFSYVAAWQFNGKDKAPTLHKEDLKFEEQPLAQRVYK